MLFEIFHFFSYCTSNNVIALRLCGSSDTGWICYWSCFLSSMTGLPKLLYFATKAIFQFLQLISALLKCGSHCTHFLAQVKNIWLSNLWGSCIPTPTHVAWMSQNKNQRYSNYSIWTILTCLDHQTKSMLLFTLIEHGKKSCSRRN